MTADRPVSPKRESSEEVLSAVPYGLRVAAAWRALLVAGALTVVGFVAVKLASVLVPVAVALLTCPPGCAPGRCT
ncbi:hypothetical protein AB0J55_00955 [Amycolatopsis sp. NPDC049688]|uniref:hypothetical protein n=1 Tax=Amycolatopsis sp. NPDC049688 TaxID=3154733 RepID=UPI0034205589